MAFYKKRIVRSDTAQDIAERIAYRKAFEQATAETLAKFSPLTIENFEAACKFKQTRIAEIQEVA